VLPWADMVNLGFEVCDFAVMRKERTLRTRSREHVERIVELEASQASAGSQLSDACLPVAIRSVWREMSLFK
jgi:hypothetical protein